MHADPGVTDRFATSSADAFIDAVHSKVSSLMIVNTLLRQVPARKMGRKSTAEINSLLVHSSN